MSLNDSFLFYETVIAKIAGQSCNILRPNYAVEDNLPVSHLSNTKIKMEPVAGAKLAHATFPNVALYTIFGDRSKFQTGDIIQPNGSGSTTPPVTVLSYSPLEECIGFSTSRLGRLCSDLNTDLFLNVYFDWVSAGFPASTLPENLAGALGIPSKKAVLFSRPGFLPQNLQDSHGYRLVEVDGTREVRWVIKLIDVIGSLTQLTLEEDH